VTRASNRKQKKAGPGSGIVRGGRSKKDKKKKKKEKKTFLRRESNLGFSQKSGKNERIKAG